MTKIKKFVFVLILMIMIVVYAFAVNGDLSDEMVRLHVIANSNTDYDQKLKLKVRDAVLSETVNLTDGITDKKKAVKTITDNRGKIIDAAEKVIKENGYDYGIEMEYGNFFFPEKEYDNIELPSGKYDAIRIKIGKAKGENWWCIMFPPLCVSADATGKLDDKAIEYLKSELTDKEFELVQKGKTTPTVIRFRIVDTVMKLAEHLA